MTEQTREKTIDAGTSLTLLDLTATERRIAQAWLEDQARQGITFTSYSISGSNLLNFPNPTKEPGNHPSGQEKKHPRCIFAHIFRFLK